MQYFSVSKEDFFCFVFNNLLEVCWVPPCVCSLTPGWAFCSGSLEEVLNPSVSYFCMCLMLHSVDRFWLIFSMAIQKMRGFKSKRALNEHKNNMDTYIWGADLYTGREKKESISGMSTLVNNSLTFLSKWRMASFHGTYGSEIWCNVQVISKTVWPIAETTLTADFVSECGSAQQKSLL